MYLTFNSCWDKPTTGEKKADVAHTQDITSYKLRTSLFSVYWAVYVIINHDSMINTLIKHCFDLAIILYHLQLFPLISI